MENRYCPLMEEEIESSVCFDIHMVVEKMAPNRTAPEKAAMHPDRDKICLKCKNHIFD